MQVIINTQKALYAALTSGLEIEVFDHVPDGAAMPYVTIGNSTLTHNPHLGGSAFEINFMLYAYAASKGRKELFGIGEAIFGILNNGDLEIEGFTHLETVLLNQLVDMEDRNEKYALRANSRVLVS